MENALRACCKGIKIGKILIHRVGDDGKQVGFGNVFYFVNTHVTKYFSYELFTGLIETLFF